MFQLIPMKIYTDITDHVGSEVCLQLVGTPLYSPRQYISVQYITVLHFTVLTTFKTRLNFIKSYVIEKLIYAMPLYMGINNILLNKLHKVIMSAARAAIGNYCYKKSINYILNKCNLMDIKHIILYSSLSFLFKMYKDNLPTSLMSHFIQRKEKDRQFKLRPLHIPKMKAIENSLFHKGALIFNNLPDKYKVLNMNKFQHQLRIYLCENSVFDTCD